SEAASRLDKHVRPVQEFLEALAALGILQQTEITDKTRPYFRYALAVEVIELKIDLRKLKKQAKTKSGSDPELREKKDSGAGFSVSRDGTSIASVTLRSGSGRSQKQRLLKLTPMQGLFLYHCPFPNAYFKSQSEIMRVAGIEESYRPEIDDLVQLLVQHGVLESRSSAEEKLSAQKARQH
ncbi:hypothetical protein JW935_26870, partial [candidate division KSB1 bacterium]|nr:hypothetical protein [candidate division KSB1 bacterium]